MFKNNIYIEKEFFEPINFWVSSYHNSTYSGILTGGWGFPNASTVIFEKCYSIDNGYFKNNQSLTKVSFPLCQYIKAEVFGYCRNLIEISFPVCGDINYGAFEYCTSLISASFSVCGYIGHDAFWGCSSLTTILLGNSNLSTSNKILSRTFYNCCNLISLTLAYNSIIELVDSNAFRYTPIAGYSHSTTLTPYIYVPSSLMTAYQTATNWSYFSSRFSTIGE